MMFQCYEMKREFDFPFCFKFKEVPCVMLYKLSVSFVLLVNLLISTLT
jgi:hypothetical protein